MSSLKIEKIKKRCKNTEELYKKRRAIQSYLNDLDNHNGVIIHLEPDSLDYEVKWASVIITTNIANGGDGIPAELFEILKDDAVKVLHSICQQIWKTQQCFPELEKVIFHFNSKERQCQRMFKPLYNCSHFTC